MTFTAPKRQIADITGVINTIFLAPFITISHLVFCQRGHVLANLVEPRFPTFATHSLTTLYARPRIEQRLLDLIQKTFAISADAAQRERIHFGDRGRNHWETRRQLLARL